MSADDRRPSLEAVLDAFAAEGDADRMTLERYLRLYPEYVGEIVDLASEMRRELEESSAPLTTAELALIDLAWARYVAGPQQIPAKPAPALTAEEWRTVAQLLGVPRQVVTALRERRVALSTIPRGFLRRFAEATGSSLEELQSAWTSVPLVGARSYKADDKPNSGGQVAFEQVLIEAGVSDDKRAQLLGEAK